MGDRENILSSSSSMDISGFGEEFACFTDDEESDVKKEEEEEEEEDAVLRTGGRSSQFRKSSSIFNFLRCFCFVAS